MELVSIEEERRRESSKMGTETVTSLAKAGDGEGLKLHIKVGSLF